MPIIIDIKPMLERLKVPTEDIDFILKNSTFSIGSAVHSAIIEVNEVGTVAAAGWAKLL